MRPSRLHTITPTQETAHYAKWRDTVADWMAEPRQAYVNHIPLSPYCPMPAASKCRARMYPMDGFKAALCYDRAPPHRKGNFSSKVVPRCGGRERGEKMLSSPLRGYLVCLVYSPVTDRTCMGCVPGGLHSLLCLSGGHGILAGPHSADSGVRALWLVTTTLVLTHKTRVCARTTDTQPAGASSATRSPRMASTSTRHDTDQP